MINEEVIQFCRQGRMGVWGLLRVLQGEVRLVFHDPHREVTVTTDSPAPIPPEALHHVEVTGAMRMQVEFYREPPLPDATP